jgi:hypothetical protein
VRLPNPFQGKLGFHFNVLLARLNLFYLEDRLQAGKGAGRNVISKLCPRQDCLIHWPHKKTVKVTELRSKEISATGPNQSQPAKPIFNFSRLMRQNPPPKVRQLSRPIHGYMPLLKNDICIMPH